MTSRTLISWERAMMLLGLTTRQLAKLAARNNLEIVLAGRARRMIFEQLEPLQNDDWVLVHNGKAPSGWMLKREAASELGVSTNRLLQLGSTGLVESRLVDDERIFRAADVFRRKSVHPPKPKTRRISPEKMTAAEVRETLQISGRTLKAIVGRGQLTTAPGTQFPEYDRAEVLRLKEEPAFKELADVLPPGYMAPAKAAGLAKIPRQRLSAYLKDLKIPYIVVNGELCPRADAFIRMNRNFRRHRVRRVARERAYRTGIQFGRTHTIKVLRKLLKLSRQQIDGLRAEGYLRWKAIAGNHVVFWKPSEEAYARAAEILAEKTSDGLSPLTLIAKISGVSTGLVEDVCAKRNVTFVERGRVKLLSEPAASKIVSLCKVRRIAEERHIKRLRLIRAGRPFGRSQTVGCLSESLNVNFQLIARLRREGALRYRLINGQFFVYWPPSATVLARIQEVRELRSQGKRLPALKRMGKATNPQPEYPEGLRPLSEIAEESGADLSVVSQIAARLGVNLTTIGDEELANAQDSERLDAISYALHRYGLVKLELPEAARIIGSQITIRLHEDRGEITPAGHSENGTPVYDSFEVALLRFRRDTKAIPKAEAERGIVDEAEAADETGLSVKALLKQRTKDLMFRTSLYAATPYFRAEIEWFKRHGRSLVR